MSAQVAVVTRDGDGRVESSGEPLVAVTSSPAARQSPGVKTTQRNARPRGTGGLEFRKTQAGQTIIYARWREGTTHRRKRLGVMRASGSRIGLTKKEAEGLLRELLAGSPDAPSVSERVGVEDAAKRYIASKRLGLKPATLVDYESITRCHLPYFSGKRLDEVDDDLVERWRDRMLEGVSPKTAANAMTFLGGVFRHALRKKWINHNPMQGVPKPTAKRSHDIRFLTREEIAALLRAAPKDATGQLDCAAILVSAQTGLRQGELLALRWKDVDFAASVVRVRQSAGLGGVDTPKSRRSNRATPLSPQAAAALEGVFQASRWRGDDDYVFAHPATGRVQDASNLRKRFADILKAAQLDRHVRWHDLRHSFGTSMAAAGAPMRAIQDWMGHASITTTEIYADWSPDPSQGVAFAERAFGADPLLSGGAPVARNGASRANLTYATERDMM